MNIAYSQSISIEKYLPLVILIAYIVKP